jgi:hypothetical protein
MLTWIETPGLYVQPDKGLAWAFDHIDARVLSHAGGRVTVRLTNPMKFSAHVRDLVESSHAAREPHDVYFVFHADNDRELGHFSLFRLEGYRGTMGFQTDELRIEVRLGRRDGEKIGDIYPVNTNGAFRETIVRTARPVPSYRGDVFLVVRSATRKLGCKLDWISLETAR